MWPFKRKPADPPGRMMTQAEVMRATGNEIGARELEARAAKVRLEQELFVIQLEAENEKTRELIKKWTAAHSSKLSL